MKAQLKKLKEGLAGLEKLKTKTPKIRTSIARIKGAVTLLESEAN